MSVRHRLLGRDLLYMVASAGQIGTALCVTPFATRLYGAGVYGRVTAYLTLTQVLVPVIALGMSVGVQRLYASDPDGARRVVGRAVLSISLLTIGFGILGPLWSPALGFGKFGAAQLLMTAYSGVSAWVALFLAYLRAADRLLPFFVVTACDSTLNGIVALIVAAAIRPAATPIMAAYLGSEGVGLVVALCYTRRPLSNGRWRPHSSSRRKATSAELPIRLEPSGDGRGEFRSVVWFSLPLIANAVALFVINSSDRIVIQRDLGTAAVAAYQVAYTGGALLISVLLFLHQSWLPTIFEAQSPAERRVILRFLREESAKALAAGTAVVALVAPVVLRVWSPASFGIHRMLVATLVVLAGSITLSEVLAMTRALLVEGRSHIVGACTAVGAVVNLIANLVLVPAVGLAGAAVGTAISLVAWFAALRLAARLRGIAVGDLTTTKVLISEVGSLGAIAGTYWMSSHGPWLAVRLVLAMAVTLAGTSLILRKRKPAASGVATVVSGSSELPALDV